MAPRFDVTSGYAPSGAAKIYFESAGTGRNLIFAHAGISDSRMWDPQFESFAERFRVVRYDHRGFGKSKLTDEPYALADDLLNVLRHLSVAKTALVGCSMGGTAAIDFALEHPEMVAALVLVGSGVSGLNDPKELSAEAIKHWIDSLAWSKKAMSKGRVKWTQSIGSMALRATRQKSPRSIAIVLANFIARISRSSASHAKRSR